MTEITNIKVEGLRHLRDVLIKHIPAKAQERVIAGALRRSFKPMVQKAKSNAITADSSGALAAAVQMWKVGKSKKRKRKKTFVSMEVGPRRSNKKAIAQYILHYGVTSLTPAEVRLGLRYGHLVEYGVPSRGIAANPFLRNAFDSKARGGVESFRKEFGKGIEREAKRQARLQVKGKP